MVALGVEGDDAVVGDQGPGLVRINGLLAVAELRAAPAVPGCSSCRTGVQIPVVDADFAEPPLPSLASKFC